MQEAGATATIRVTALVTYALGSGLPSMMSQGKIETFPMDPTELIVAFSNARRENSST